MDEITQALQRGTLLDSGKYRIEAVLGQGGFGITYLATDLSLDRKVAVKEFFPETLCFREGMTGHVTLGTEGSRDFVERFKAKFLKEARNIAKFDHPGIIRIHAAFEENNTAYYVMEYIEGQPLSAIVKRNGPLGEAEAVKLISQVGEALDYIHARRINHLDVKPANIMVRYSGEPVLIDFGLSKQYDSTGQQTSTTPVGFSHGYAPFEQYKDGGLCEFTPATDIYSLAATLYYILSGTVPPPAPDLVEEKLTFPPSIPRHLVAPIRKAMSNARKSRHASVMDFVGELKVPREPRPESQIIRRAVVLIAAVLMAIIGVVVWRNVSSNTENPDDTDTIPDCLTEDVIPEDSFPSTEEKSADSKYAGHDYVDLGLPSGLKWATMNLGASSPSDYGYYYAWGETITKVDYTKNTSKTYGKTMGDIGGNPSYDAARANWGGSWRLPTKAEFDELLNRCKWTRITQGGHKGCMVTGPNGKSIFLPAAGWGYGTSLDDAGEYGVYWSSTPYESYRAYYLYFDSGDRGKDVSFRNFGHTVRAVSE